MALTAIVLGSAAGGGFPQWNCRCSVCALAWAGDPRVKPRTQASVAVSADGRHWVLLNAAPELREQIARTPALHPRALRDSPIAAVLLSGAEIDQTAGLLTLRERQSFVLVATAETHAALAANPMFAALVPDLVARKIVEIGEIIELPGGLRAELFKAPGKAPLYLEGDNPALDAETEANVGIELTDGQARLAFVPGCAAINPALLARFGRADAVLFDGTLFTDDEMIATGTGPKTGRRMGHMPMTGEGGSLAALAGLRARRIYIHINNTNSVLIDGSAERAKVAAAGWEIAEDGFRIKL
jgi:pyrroloquinoline quinone biosynthesis protein B